MMATVSGTELLYKRDTRLGLTTLTFRKRRYHGDERLLSASTGDLRDECVMLDVGLSCPHCYQSVTLTATQSKVVVPDGSRSPPPADPRSPPAGPRSPPADPRSPPADPRSRGQLTSSDDVQAEASRIVPQIEEGARRIALLTGSGADSLDPEEVQAEARRIVSEIEEGAHRDAAQRASEVLEAASPRPDGHQRQLRVGDRQRKWPKPAGIAEETEIKIGFSSLPRHQGRQWSGKQGASPGGRGSKLSCSDYESLDREPAAPTRGAWDGRGHDSAETFNSATLSTTNSHVDDAYGSMDSSQYSSQSLASNPARQYYSLPHNVRLETLLVDSMEIEESDINEEALVNELLCDEILDEEYAKLKAKDKRRLHGDVAVMTAAAAAAAADDDDDSRAYDGCDDEESQRRARRTSDEETAMSAEEQSDTAAHREKAGDRRPASGSGEARTRRRAGGSREKEALFQIDDADEVDAFRDGSPAEDSDRSTSPETLVDDVLENIDSEIYTADATLRRVFAVGRELIQNGQHSAGRPRQTSKQRRSEKPAADTAGSRRKDCRDVDDGGSSATKRIKLRGIPDSKRNASSPGAADDSHRGRRERPEDRQPAGGSSSSSVDFCHEVFLDQVLEALTELEGGFATDLTSDYDSDNTNSRHATRPLFVLGGLEADAESYKELLDVCGYRRRATATSSCECLADERTPELDSSTERVSSAPYTSPSDGSVSSGSDCSNPDRSGGSGSGSGSGGEPAAPTGSGADRRLFEQLVRDTESLTEELMEEESAAAPGDRSEVWIHRGDVIRPDKRAPRAQAKGQSSAGSNRGRSSVGVDVVRNFSAVPAIVLSEAPAAGDDVSEDSSDDVSNAADDVDTSLENLLTCNVIHCSTSDLDEIYVRELNYVDGERPEPEPSQPTSTGNEIDEFVPETDANRPDPLNEEFRDGEEQPGSACGRLGERKIVEKTSTAGEDTGEDTGEDSSVIARDAAVEVVSTDGGAVVGSDLRQYVQSQTRQVRHADTHDTRLDGCIEQRCQTCDFKPQAPGEVVKKEEFITEEVTLVFKWPKKMSLNREVPFKMAGADKRLVAKSTAGQRVPTGKELCQSASDSKGKQQPYRTVHLRRVMRVSDYDVDAPVEAPSTVKMVEYRDGRTEERCLVQTREQDGSVRRVQTDVEVSQPRQCLHTERLHTERLHEAGGCAVQAAVTDGCSAAQQAGSDPSGEVERPQENRERNSPPSEPGTSSPSTSRATTAECLQEDQGLASPAAEGSEEDSGEKDIESLAEAELARYEQTSESFSLPALDDAGLRQSERLYDVSCSTSERLMSQNESSVAELYGQHLTDVNDIYERAELDAAAASARGQAGQMDEGSTGEQMSSEALIEAGESRTQTMGATATSTDGVTTSCQVSSEDSTVSTKQDESAEVSRCFTQMSSAATNHEKSSPDEADETGSGTRAGTASEGDAGADAPTSLNLIPQTERNVVVLNLGKYFSEQPDVSSPCLFAGDEPLLGQRPGSGADPESTRCPRCSEIRLEDILAMSQEDGGLTTADPEATEEDRRRGDAEEVQRRGAHPVPCQRCIMLEREIRIKLMELSRLIEELGKRRNQRQDEGSLAGHWRGSEGDMDEKELEKLSRETAENIRILKRGIARLNFYRHGKRTDMGADIVISKQQVSEDIRISGNAPYGKGGTDGPTDISSQEAISDKGEQCIDASSNKAGYGEKHRTPAEVASDKVTSDKTRAEWDGLGGGVLSCDKAEDGQTSVTYSTRVIRKRKAKKLSQLMEVFDAETGASRPQLDRGAAGVSSPESQSAAAGYGFDGVANIAPSSSSVHQQGEPLAFRDRLEIFAENLAKYILFRAKLYIVLENPATRIPCLQNEQVLTPAGQADNHQITDARVLTPSGQNKEQRADANGP